jgi:hypothetical protein
MEDNALESEMNGPGHILAQPGMSKLSSVQPPCSSRLLAPELKHSPFERQLSALLQQAPVPFVKQGRKSYAVIGC